MQKLIQYIYYGMLMVGLLLIIACGWDTMDGSQEIDLISTPAQRVEQPTNAEQNYYFDVSHMEKYGLDVVFLSHHQFVKIFADNELIYENVKDGGIWGRTNGTLWHFISIPYGTNELKVQMFAAYTSVENENHVFYFGDKLQIFKALFKDSLIPMCISLLLLVMGAALIIYSILVNKRVYTGNSLLYLGIFILLFSLWSFNETDAATLIFNHRISSGFAAYIYLMTMSSSFLLFTREFIRIEEKFIWKIICWISVVEFVLCLTLQFTGIADFKETLIMTHLVMVISLSYIILVLLIKLIRGQLAKSLKNNLFALLILISAVLVDLVFYYRGNLDADLFGRFIFFLFAIVLGKEALGSTMKVLERGKKAQMYEELAITDSLTGLYNRNAYEADVAELNGKTDIWIVTCDLNNLKTCNDTLGHSEGDNYIKEAARLIELIFNPYGKCYRIGGDEFLVLIQNTNCPIDTLLKQLLLEEEHSNASKKIKFPLHIAAGASLYDKHTDNCIEDARNRADKYMYEEKRKSKEGL